jgi:hypothetical protein
MRHAAGTLGTVDSLALVDAEPEEDEGEEKQKERNNHAAEIIPWNA